MPRPADPAARARIDRLADRVLEAAASTENRRRREGRSFSFALEEPIAWTIIEDLDPERYYADAAYFVERSLTQKLWRWDTFPDDGAPIEPTLPASLGFYPDYTYAGMSLHWDARGVPILQEDHPLRRDANLALLDGIDVERGGWMPRALAWHERCSLSAAGRHAVRGDVVAGVPGPRDPAPWLRGVPE
jgi:hypothetical protein